MAAALRMTDNEPVFSALTSAAGTGCQGSSSELQHATSSQSTSSEETPLPSKAEETKGHTADDEGKSNKVFQTFSFCFVHQINFRVNLDFVNEK